MQRNHLVLLLITSPITGSAFAQSSVTLYGLADVGIEIINHVPALGGTSQRVIRETSGSAQPSRFGILVKEDLGGTWAAIANLESGINMTNGTFNNGGREFGRSAYVGLSGPYGKLTIGRQTNVMYDFALFSDPMAPSEYSIPMFDTDFAGRADNAVKYAIQISTVLGKSDATLLYSTGYETVAAGAVGQVPGAYRVGKEFGAAVTQQAGPFSIGVAYEQENGTSIATQNGYVQRIGAGATLSTQSVTLYGAYRLFDQKILGGTAISSLSWLALRYLVSPAFSVSTTFYYQNGRSQSKGNPKSISLLASYLLSKRTDIYVQAGTAFNSAASNLGLDGFGTATTGSTQTGVIVGLRTHF